MKALFTSDIHASDSHLYTMLSIAERERVERLIIGGDIIPYYLADTPRLGMLNAQARYLEDVFLPAIEGFRKRTSAAIYLDFGNDDIIYNRSILKKYNKRLFYLLHFSRYRLTDDVDIIGYMNVPPTPFKIKDWERPDSIERPYPPDNKILLKGYMSANGILEEAVLDLKSDDSIESELRRLSGIIDRPFIFISHAPPYKTPLDVLYNGHNVGSISIRNFIEEWSDRGLLIASFHGHIHESPEKSGSNHTMIGDALCVNPGQGNGKGAEFRYVIFELLKNKVFLDL